MRATTQLRRLVPAAALLASAGAFGQGQVAELTASDAQDGDRFAVPALEGDIVVVGANLEDTAGPSAGAAYIFARDEGGPDNWGEVVKLLPNDTDDNDWFGQDVDISGDTVVVAARNDDSGATAAGSVYIFERNLGGPDNWGLVTEITASDAAANDHFGNSVAIDGDTIVVGAWFGDDDVHVTPGSAYVYERDLGGADNWGEVTELIASDADDNDSFGWSVAISGDTIVVGAYAEDGAGSGRGAAYVFERDAGGTDNWGETKKLTASDGEDTDFFGRAVTIDGDTVIVGADLDDTANENDIGCDSGSAYVFERDAGGAGNWGEVAKLFDPDGGCYNPTGDAFGVTCSVSGDFAVIGAPGDDDGAVESGSAFVFHRNQGGADAWGLVTKFRGDDTTLLDSFGAAVDMTGTLIVAGAPGDDDGATDGGSVYIMDAAALALSYLDCNGNGTNDVVEILLTQTGADCNGNGILDECDIAAGTSADDDEDGIPDECASACTADSDDDGDVDVDDFLAVLAQWGACPP